MYIYFFASYQSSIKSVTKMMNVQFLSGARKCSLSIKPSRKHSIFVCLRYFLFADSVEAEHRSFPSNV